MNRKNIKISIMQREFAVSCDENETEQLMEAAAYLDQQMRQVADGNQLLGADRCAIMAGLNMAHKLLQLQSSVSEKTAIDNRIQKLSAQVDTAVTNLRQTIS